MKKQNRNSWAIIGVAGFVFGSFAVAQESPLKLLKWGLEKDRYYEERQVPAEASSAIRKQAEPGEKLFRFFCTNAQYEKEIMSIFERYNKSWDEFRKTEVEDKNDTDEQELVQKQKRSFARFLGRNDPHLAAKTRELAPVVSFNFVGTSGAEYVLEEIEINTIDFAEYSGGGFFDKEAWYDIELCHKKGIKKYAINKNLRFTGSGRCELRFWSDNYYTSMGMAPMGCYDVDITFHFLMNGKRVSVATGRFKVDV